MNCLYLKKPIILNKESKVTGLILNNKNIRSLKGLLEKGDFISSFLNEQTSSSSAASSLDSSDDEQQDNNNKQELLISKQKKHEQENKTPLRPCLKNAPLKELVNQLEQISGEKSCTIAARQLPTMSKHWKNNCQHMNKHHTDLASSRGSDRHQRPQKMPLLNNFGPTMSRNFRIPPSNNMQQIKCEYRVVYEQHLPTLIQQQQQQLYQCSSANNLPTMTIKQPPAMLNQCLSANNLPTMTMRSRQFQMEFQQSPPLPMFNQMAPTMTIRHANPVPIFQKPLNNLLSNQLPTMTIRHPYPIQQQQQQPTMTIRHPVAASPFELAPPPPPQQPMINQLLSKMNSRHQASKCMPNNNFQINASQQHAFYHNLSPRQQQQQPTLFEPNLNQYFRTNKCQCQWKMNQCQMSGSFCPPQNNNPFYPTNFLINC
jgi:hypothetical protein